VLARRGTLSGAISCPLHRLRFALDGTSADPRESAGLVPLELATSGGLLFVAMGAPAGTTMPGHAAAAPRIDTVEPGSTLSGNSNFAEHDVPADWKLAVEQLLLHRMPEHDVQGGLQDFSAPALQVDLPNQQLRWQALPVGAQELPWRRVYLWPNMLLEWRPDGISAIQVVPLAAGHSRWQCFEYRRRQLDEEIQEPGAGLRARRAEALRLDIDLASSTQRGLASPGYRANQQGSVPAGIAAFRQLLETRLL
jgi:phenylpropionate dioxygenase-like ring-hydroxylating dioxygenase large terminal subunit